MGKELYNVDKIVYISGGEQKKYFIQFKSVIEKFGLPYINYIKHVNYGLVLKDSKEMPTLKGRIVKLYDILLQEKAEFYL